MKSKKTLKHEVEKLNAKREKMFNQLSHELKGDLNERVSRFGKLSSFPPVNFSVSNKTDAPELNHYISILEEDIRVLRKALDGKTVLKLSMEG